MRQFSIFVFSFVQFHLLCIELRLTSVLFFFLQMENLLVSRSLNETQMSTLPLNDFSLMEEQQVPYRTEVQADEG